jgi:hypothetical protein
MTALLDLILCTATKKLPIKTTQAGMYKEVAAKLQLIGPITGSKTVELELGRNSITRTMVSYQYIYMSVKSFGLMSVTELSALLRWYLDTSTSLQTLRRLER